MTAEIMTRRIPDYARENVEARLGKLAKKAIRLGCPAPTWRFGEPIFVPHYNEQRLGAVINFGPREPDYYTTEYDLTVEAETIALAGQWRLVAAVDFVTDEENNRVPIIRTVPGETIPATYQATTAYCGHCKTDRRRVVVYVVENAAGETMQVGSDCVQTALGINPALLANYWRVWAEAGNIGEGDDDFGGGHARAHYTPAAIILVATAVIRQYGWRKADTARYEGGMSGGATVRDILTADAKWMQKNYPDFTVTDADREKAEAVLEWAPEIDGESEYAHNVRTLATLKAVEPKYVGILGSAVLAYDRAHAVAETFVNEPLGEVAKRLTFAATLVDERTFEGNYGTAHLLIFKAAGGQRVTWFASKAAEALGITKGTPIMLKATVKKVAERNGTLETQVTRGAVQ
jgi:hypothetical protein